MKIRVPSVSALLGLVLLFAFAVPSAISVNAAGKESKLVIHVSENDPAKMKLALNVVKATKKQFADKGNNIVIEVVVNAQGLHMMRADTSPVKKEIGLLATKFDNLRFSACGTTISKMNKKEGKPIKLITEARRVTGGVLRIIELQEAGYSYIRP